MKAKTRLPRMFTRLALVLGLGTATLALAPMPSAEAAAVIPVLIDGTWYKLQSSWKEQCSATLYIQTDWDAYTKIPRGVAKYVKPYSNGGNDGEFKWRCGSSNEDADAGSSDFNLLQAKHSDVSREISMTAFDKCGNGASVQQCY